MRAFIWVLSICTLMFVVVYIFEDNIRRSFFPNHVLLNSRGEADPGLVRIDWTAEGSKDTVTIYESRQDLNAIYEAQERNVFMVYYKGKRIGHFEHFKSNAFHPHTYVFELLLQDDSVYLDLNISGPDATR